MPTYLVQDTYATIALALAAIPADLSGTGVHEVIIEAGTYNEEMLVTGYANQSVTDYINIHAKAGDEHKGVRGAGVVVARTSTAYNIVSCSYLILKDLEFSNFGSSRFCLRALNNTNCIFENLIATPLSLPTYGMIVEGSDNCELRKCIVEGGHSSFYSTGTTLLYNCVSLNSGHYGISYGTHINCVSINAATSDYRGGGVGVGDYNVDSDGTSVGVNSLHNKTLAECRFANSSSNFHIKQGSILNGAGIDQSSLFTRDIDGDIIDTANWPVGVDYLLPTCWTYTARYKNSKRLYRADGPGVYPTSLNVPSNVDLSTGQMVDEGQLIDPSKYSIN